MARKRKDAAAKPQAPGKGLTQGGSALKSKAKKKRLIRLPLKTPTVLPDEIDIEEEDLEATDTPTPPSQPRLSSLRPNVSPIVPLARLARLAHSSRSVQESMEQEIEVVETEVVTLLLVKQVERDSLLLELIPYWTHPIFILHVRHHAPQEVVNINQIRTPKKQKAF
ncbi:hypothetical protein K435DRAFT_794862 [Dendrothele bispora CBS 962.96]|uniref:Uncharacterized protein n=1 Tax=Dendrothele bispora (strain CBS 962.96) TaxID=1314807 RepID=A0A4S8MAM9_DENBC|nr:hypothetical protein K435DRAFT_794862 [Dendrothele bispora CBS 962.96]